MFRLSWPPLVVLAFLTAALPAGSRRAARPPAPPSALAPLVRVLASSDDVEVQRDVLRGMTEALRGRRAVKAPPGWTAVYRKLSASKDGEVRDRVRVLSVLFGDPVALAELRKLAADVRAPEASRRTAVQTLVDRRADGTVALLRELVADRALRRQAVRGLAAFDDAGTPALLLSRYASFGDAEKADAIATLASRPAYARALLDAVERKQVPRQDVSAFTARQIAALNDRALTERLTSVWGAIRPTAKDREKLLARYLKVASPSALKKADRGNGRLLFQKTCAQCHKLFGEGGTVGPDLTGSQRANPEYLLSKVLDPSAAVARDYQVTVIVTSAGRTITGIVKEESEKVIALQTPTEVVRVARSDVEDRSRSPVSLMPEGQLATLSDQQVRDLLAYLGGPGQVPLPGKAP